MINRIALKTNDVILSETSIQVGSQTILEIPLVKINHISFSSSTEKDAGILFIVKNNFEDVDIIFFHKDFEEFFKNFSDKVKARISK